jgi:integrase
MSRSSALVKPVAERYVLHRAVVHLTGSDFSFWTADIWEFPHSNPATPVIRFQWRFALPSGGWSTDPEHEVLLESFKTVVWGMLTNDAYGKKLSVGTLATISGGVREAFRWFVWNGIEDFSQLSSKFLGNYVDALPQLIVDKEEVYPGFVAEGYDFGHHSPSVRRRKKGVFSADDEAVDEDLLNEDAANEPVVSARVQEGEGDQAHGQTAAGETAEEEDDGVSYSQIANRVSVLYYIYAQRLRLRERNLPALMDRPFKGKTFGQVSSRICPHVINRIPALPQAVSLPLLDEVLRWVDKVGPKVKVIHEAFHFSRKRSANALDAVFADLDAAGFSTSRFAAIAWRERLEGRDESLGDPLDFGNHRMRLATLMYRDACVLALQYLAGFRISEVCSVMVECEKVNGLPSCIYKRSSPDGMMDLYFLRAKLVKGRPRPKDKDWVIGCVPAGSNQVPILVRALEHLHGVLAPFLVKGKQTPLFFHYSNPWGMPKSRGNVVQAKGTDLQRGCRRFIRCFVDLTQLPEHDSFGNSLVRYRESRGACIRTHQGRKTFADYCLKTRKSSLSALSFHFGHLNETVTYKGYYEPIQRHADEIESMAYSATVDYMVSHSGGGAVFGNMAEAVNEFLADHKLDSITDVTLLRPKVKELVLAHDIRIFFNDFGNCFISAAPMKSRCQKAAGGTSWLLRKPNYGARSISMCAGCDCFALDASHRPYWVKREKDWRQPAKNRTNRVAVSRHAQSVAVIRLFDKRKKS